MRIELSKLTVPQRTVLLFVASHSMAKIGRDVSGIAANQLVAMGLLNKSQAANQRGKKIRSFWVDATPEGSEVAAQLLNDLASAACGGR